MLKTYLKDSGKLVLFTKNLLHGSTFLQILKGKFETVKDKDKGIQHFYTLRETTELLSEVGLIPRFILKMTYSADLTAEETALLETVKAIPGVWIGQYNFVVHSVTATQK